MQQKHDQESFQEQAICDIVRRALDEDIGDGDVTSMCTVPPELMIEGKFITKAAGIIAGLEIARLAFALLDERVQFQAHVTDGTFVESGTVIATVYGAGRTLLSAERVSLNFLQRMSGIATATNQYVKAVAGTKAKILDTRKTVPGLRILDKAAVKIGGGENHRIGLYDMVLIKENHITAAGGITAAVNQVRALDPRGRAIEVEVQTLDELREALPLGVDQIMLDNMNLDQMRSAVAITNGAVPLEASGNVSLETIAQIAATGVDYISVGKLTHSVQAFDISFLL